MSTNSFLCNTLYLKNGYNNINVESDCTPINPQDINASRHLLHLSDPSVSKDYYVCRGIYDYKNNTCELNDRIKNAVDAAPVPPSNVPIPVNDVNAPVNPPTVNDGNTWNELQKGKFCAESDTKNLPLGNNGDLSSNNSEDRYNNTLQQCKMKCQDDPNCNFISFTESENGDCLKYNQCPAFKTYGDGTKGTVTLKLNNADKNITPQQESKLECACGDVLDPETNLCKPTNKPSVDTWLSGQGGWCKTGEIADMVKTGYDPSRANEVKDWYLSCRSTPEEKALCD